jgi:hypothetical protein
MRVGAGACDSMKDEMDGRTAARGGGGGRTVGVRRWVGVLLAESEPTDFGLRKDVVGWTPKVALSLSFSARRVFCRMFCRGTPKSVSNESHIRTNGGLDGTHLEPDLAGDGDKRTSKTPLVVDSLRQRGGQREMVNDAPEPCEAADQ